MRDIDHVLFVLGAIGYALVTIRVLVDVLLRGYIIGLMDQGPYLLGDESRLAGMEYGLELLQSLRRLRCVERFKRSRLSLEDFHD